MTIRELFDWAEENGCLDAEIYCNGYGIACDPDAPDNDPNDENGDTVTLWTR